MRTRNLIPAIIATATLAVSCVDNIDITRFVTQINQSDAKAIEEALPVNAVIAVGERRLVPDLVDGSNPIATNVYPTLGGLIPSSSNKAVVDVARKDDSSFYIIGVAPGQATVFVNYIDFSQAIQVIVDQTLVEEIIPPADYHGAVRDSVVFSYKITPENASRGLITATSDNRDIRAHVEGDRIAVYAAAAGTATIAVTSGKVSSSFHFTADKTPASDIRFEVPVDPLRHRIDDYAFNPSAYATPIPASNATLYPGVINDFYREFYTPVQEETVVRHSPEPFDLHVGVYPLTTTDYGCSIRVISAYYIAEYDGEYGRRGSHVSIDESLFYKYFTIDENTGGGRHNDFSITPHRPCIILLSTSAGTLATELTVEFKLDADTEPAA